LDDTTCIPKGDNRSFHRNKLEIIFPRVLADTIIDSFHAVTTGKFQNLFDDIFLSIKDDMVGAILFRQFGFLRGRSRPYDTSPKLLCELYSLKTESTSGGMNKNPIIWLDSVSFFEER